MKLIRSGGCNASLAIGDQDYRQYGFGNYFMLQIKGELEELIAQGKIIAVCVAAKLNKHHYDQRFIDMGFSADDFTILGREDNAEWGKYSAVLLLGGDTKALHEWLNKTKFSINNLKKCQLLGGDSAGAYVLSGKTLFEYSPGGESFRVIDGFIPRLNQLIAAHANNSHFHKPGLSRALSTWCTENNVEYIELEENQLNSLVI